MSTPLNNLLHKAERIAVIGSPSTTAELTLDILGTAVSKRLVGELVVFSFVQEGKPHYALGQITEIQLRNVWHEEPTMRSLIRQRGQVGAVSEQQDTHIAKMVVSAVFALEGSSAKDSQLGTVPSTGTSVYLVKNEILEELLKHLKKELFYLGYAYGSDLPLPLWFKHFGSGSGGAGEAYHIGIFGKTGSGKSSLAKMLLVAYARHTDMGLLVLDPQGEFSKEFSGQPSTSLFALPLPKLMQMLNRPVRVVKIRDLVLDRWELFEEILFESKFFERLTVPKGENRQLAVQFLRELLEKKKVKLEDLHKRESFDIAWRALGEESHQKIFYRSEGSRERFHSSWKNQNSDEFYRHYWLPVAELFRVEQGGDKSPRRRKVEGLLRELFAEPKDGRSRPLLIIDLSTEAASSDRNFSFRGAADSELPFFAEESSNSHDAEPPFFWNEKIQLLVIRRLLQGVRQAAEWNYKEGRGLNTLILIDEAHRLAPRERQEEGTPEASITAQLVDAVRTTRKYGLGWLFISQTLSSLHRDIINQLRIFFFGFGLSMGAELRALKELIGEQEEALDLYQLFRDPHSSFDERDRRYSFMTIGPVSPLSFSGTPLFFNAFNRVEDFLAHNNLSIAERSRY